MDNYNRNKDLIQIFDERWKANNNKQMVNNIHNKDKNMNNRLFNNNRNVFANDRDITVKGRVDRLQKNINSANEVSLINKRNNFKNNIGR